MNGGTSIAADQDLWAFIGNELKTRIPENSRIREQKQKYLRNKSYLHDVTLQIEPYMYWITGQVKKRNMSMELVLLPIVESAFDPHATSSANAADVRQIVPSTGHNHGLKQTRSYDACHNVVVSTTAVLDMMQRLNKISDSDWLLTAAAYNSGEGRVMKVIKTNKAHRKSADPWSLSSPREIRQYAPRVLALNGIPKNSKRHGVRLPITDESRALARIRLSSPVEMTQVADMADIPVSKLETFNAGTKGSALGTSGPQYVMVPKKHAEKLCESLASGEVTTVQSTLVADNTPLSNRSYRARSNDTFSDVASRLGMSTNDLRQQSNLRGSSLKADQNLTMGAGTSAQCLANNGDNIAHRVCEGDLLLSIAKRHGASIKDIVCWNNDTDNLQPGDQFMLFVENNGTPDS